MNTRLPIVLLVTVALAACGTHDDHDRHDHHDHATHDRVQPQASPTADAEQPQRYTCPMHPQVVRDGPGRCPICGMDLVPVRAAAHQEGQIQVAPGVQQAMNVRTAHVDRGRLWRRIDAPARVDYDEGRLTRINPRVEGWIEDVGVNAAGEAVEQGQLLFTLYSPQLVNAQDELLVALRRDDAASARAARENLRALGVQDAAVADLERTRRVQRALPWRAESAGVVRELGIRRGAFVTPGDTLLEVADLSRMWVVADVFDRHAAWLATGQPAEVTLSYAPGERLDGEVAYVYPALDEATRALRVRIPVDNPQGALRPGMWASARIFAGPVDDVLMVPREAVIRTGTSTRVVVRTSGDHFAVREVATGMESGDWTEIRRGLDEGDEVVVSGQFLLDSEAALRAGHLRLEGAGHQH